MIKSITTALIAAGLVLSGSAAFECRAQQTPPSSVDNSLLKYFPTVIDQIGGSCAQASYIGYMFTYEMNRILDRDGSTPDHQFSYLYTWNFINGGNDEGSIGEDGLTIGFEGGIATEADFPSQYTSSQFKWTSGYDTYLRAIHHRVKKIKHFDVLDREGVDVIQLSLEQGRTRQERGYRDILLQSRSMENQHALRRPVRDRIQSPPDGTLPDRSSCHDNRGLR